MAGQKGDSEKTGRQNRAMDVNKTVNWLLNRHGNRKQPIGIADCIRMPFKKKPKCNAYANEHICVCVCVCVFE